MAELTDLQRELLQAQENALAMQALSKPDPLANRAAPGYTQPQTVEELAKAMPVKPRPKPVKLTPDLEAAFAKSAAEADAETSRNQVEQATWTAGGGAAGMLGEAARSIGEGVATMGDWPAMAGTGIGNIINRATGRPEAPLPMGINKAYNKVLPPNPSFPETRDWFNMAGPILVTGPLGAAEATIPGLFARTALTTGGAMAGSELGGAAGEHYFGKTGRTYGSMIGAGVLGGLTQPAAQYGGYRAANKLLADQGDEFVPGSSASKYAAAERLGIADKGSLALFGNQLARLIENVGAHIPGSAKLFSDARRRLYTALDETAHRVAGMIDPTGTPPRGEISEGGLGMEANQVADAAVEGGISPALNKLYDHPTYGLHTEIDPATGQPRFPRSAPSLPATQRQVLADIRNDPTTNQYYQGPTLTEKETALRESSNLIHDQAYENQLDARLQTTKGDKARLDNDPTIDPATRAMEEEKIRVRQDQIAEERALNRAPSVQSERTARQYDANSREGVPNDRSILRDTREARDTDVRNTAIAHGVNAKHYDDIERLASKLLGEKVTISNLLSDRLGNAPEESSLFTRMFGASGTRNIDQMRTLITHAPDQLRALLAKRYEQMMRGPAAGTPHGSPETLDPKSSVAWFDRQNDPTIREGYQPDRAAEQATNDLQTVFRADTGRTNRTLPGKVGNTFGSSSASTGLLGALGAALYNVLAGGSAAISGPLAAGALTIPATMRFLAHRINDPGFTQRVIHPPTLGEIANRPNLSRVLSAAATGEVHDTRRRRPNSGAR